MPLTQVGRRGANVAGILRAWSMAGQAIRLLLQSQVSRNRFTAKCRDNHRNSHVQWKQNLCYVAKAFISSETKQPNGLDVIVFLVGWGWMFIFNGHVILGNTTFTHIYIYLPHLAEWSLPQQDMQLVLDLWSMAGSCWNTWEFDARSERSSQQTWR